jgi:hypothetical protein
MRTIGTYSPSEKIHSSLSFDIKHTQTWVSGRKLLQRRKQSIGDFFIDKLGEELAEEEARLCLN